jgi:very-short-patch-repair endonuclease
VTAARVSASVDRIFAALLTRAGLPLPVPEFRFEPQRRWRADFAWPDQKLILEVEGGVFIRGRHSRGAGMLGDFEKYNRAAVLGWRLLRCTPKGLYDPETITMLQQALYGEAGR